MRLVELTKKRAAAAVAAGLAASAVGAWVFLYAPLAAEVRQKAAVFSTVHSELAAARAKGVSVSAPRAVPPLIARGDVSAVIAELSAAGKASRVDVISMTPGEIKETAGPARARSGGPGGGFLAVRMELRSGYRELADFLGKVDDLGSGLVTVAEFLAVPAKEAPEKLDVGLTLNLCLEGGEHAG